MKRFILLSLLAGSMFSCASNPMSGKISTAMMNPTLLYTGFQISRPMDNWFIYERETRSNRILVREEITTKTYDCFFEAHLYQEDSSSSSFDDFEKTVIADVTSIQNKDRLELLNISTEKATRQGQWCVNFTAKFLDRHPANSKDPLIIFNKGFVIFHPAQAKTVVQAVISQRGTETEIKEILDPDMQFLLDSVKIRDKAGRLVE